jgi:hypothetical protein
MMISATFSNISIILWRSILFVEETEYPEKTTELSQVTDKLYEKWRGKASFMVLNIHS